MHNIVHSITQVVIFLFEFTDEMLDFMLTLHGWLLF